MPRLFVVLICFTLLVLPAAEVNATGHAFIWDSVNGMRGLGSLGGDSSAVDVNDQGQVAGYSYLPDGSVHACIWTTDTDITDLGAFGGKSSSATSINNSGMVAGTFTALDDTLHAYVWDTVNGMRDMGTLGGRNSDVIAINNNGYVLGNSQTSDGTKHIFLWNVSNGIQDLGLCPANWNVKGFNDSGEAVGFIYPTSGPPSDPYGFILDTKDGTITTISKSSAGIEAYAINNHRQVAGFVRQYEVHPAPGAFVSDSSGIVQPIGTVGQEWSAAYDINDLGQAVGAVDILFNNTRQAFYWDPNQGRTLLGTLGGDNSIAYAVSNTGIVVGYSDMSVPEPYSLLALLAAIGAVTIRRKQDIA